MRARHATTPVSSTWLALLVVALAGCGAGEPPVAERSAEETAPIVVFSDRDDESIADLLAAWSTATGVGIDVRYGPPGPPPAAVAGDLPGVGTVFLSHDAISLGTLAASGRALPLPAELTAAIDPLFVDVERRWVGLTGRARVVVYDPRRLDAEELPAGLAELAAPPMRGRFGLAPLDRRFHVHLAAYRALHGAEALGRLLDQLAENEPALYPSEEELVRGVLDGEIELALADHPVLWRLRADRGDDEGAVGRLPAADASGHVDLAGAALLVETPEALDLVRYLVSPPGQARLAAATLEYPLLPEVPPAVGLVPLADLDLARVDYRAVAAAFPATEEAIRESPLLP